MPRPVPVSRINRLALAIGTALLALLALRAGLADAAASAAGVMVQPTAAAQRAAPGSVLTYTLRVTNTGDNTDTFDFDLLPGHTWPTTLTVPLSSGNHPLPFPNGAGHPVTVTVSVPAGASGSEVVAFRVRSQIDESVLATATLTTSASYPQYLPAVQHFNPGPVSLP